MLEDHIAEAKSEYAEARRRGRARYAKEVSQGRSGYLPSLEGVLEHTPLAGERYVGIEEVPLHKIVGTVSHSRARSFARGFLPLPKSPSEFSTKWEKVYAHQLNEGIVDPVELREYLNWYWVVEGNKRVSVLKYLGSYQIEAKVTRLLPRRDSEDPAVATYYRFIPFKEETGISSIWIREPDGYQRLLEHIRSHYGDPRGDKEFYRHFYNNVYIPFRELYKSYGGKKLSLTTGEAFLRYIEIAGFPEDFDDEQSRRSVEEVIKELRLKDKEVGITTEPLKQPSPSLMDTIGQIFRSGAKALKVAFVHYGSSAISAWTRDHEIARTYLEEHMKGRIRTQVYWTEGSPESFAPVIREAAKSSDVVFSTAAILYEETRKIAIEYPDVRFFVASREKSGVHVRTYSPRTHEVHYLSGMIAGALCKSRPIGFVISNYSAYAFASINAFTLGARGVNYQTRIKLSWNDHWSDDRFEPGNVPDGLGNDDELFFHNILPPYESEYQQYGLYAYKGGMFTRYATLIYDWREFYRDVLENILAGNIKDFDSISGEHARFLTYWGGIRNGILNLSVDEEHVPPETRRLVEGMKSLMQTGEFSPFTGPIEDRHGNLQVSRDQTLNYDQIISMNYLVKGIEGPFVDPEKVVTS